MVVNGQIYANGRFTPRDRGPVTIHRRLDGLQSCCSYVEEVERDFFLWRKSNPDCAIASTTLMLMLSVKRQSVYIWRNIEAHSCNHCRSGHAVRITFSECLVFSISMQCSFATWSVRLCIIFPQDLIHGKIFFKKNLLHVKCVFWLFSITFVRNISHSKKNWARHDKKFISVVM
jgi:hypothetical protein